MQGRRVGSGGNQAGREQALWQPTSDYGMDNVFSITPPTVPPESARVYEESVRVAKYGPTPPTEEDMIAYQHHITGLL